MRQPPGCAIKGQKGKVCKLLKSLYGLRQAGRIWNEVLNDFLLKQGFQQCATDECLYHIRLSNGKQLFVIIYVDDIIVAGNCLRLLMT